MTQRPLHPWDEIKRDAQASRPPAGTTPLKPPPTTEPHAPGSPLKPAFVYAAQRDWPGYFAAVAGTPARETLLKALELFERGAEADAGSGGRSFQTGRFDVDRAGEWSHQEQHTDRSGDRSHQEQHTDRSEDRPHQEQHTDRSGDRSHQNRAIDLGCGEGRDTLELLRRGWTVLAIDGHPEAFERLMIRPDLLALPGARERLDTVLSGFEGLRLARDSAELVNASFALPFCLPRHFEALWSQVVGALVAGGRFAGQFFGERDTWAALPDRSHHTRAEVERLLSGFEIEHFVEDEKDGQTVEGSAKHWHVFHVVARKRDR